MSEVVLTKTTRVSVAVRRSATINYSVGRATQPVMISHEDALERLIAEWERVNFQRLAGTPPDRGAVTVNPYWEIVRLMRLETAWGDPWPVDWYGKNNPTRTGLTSLYAWSIPSPADLAWMRRLLDGRAVIEIGAGSGYWAWQLRQLGIEVDAVDDGSWGKKWGRQWSPVRKGDASAALSRTDEALLLVWPPYDDPMAYQALTAYSGDLVFYAGEGVDGCTGDDRFHSELAKNWTEVETAPHHATYDGIHCRLTAYRRGMTK